MKYKIVLTSMFFLIASCSIAQRYKNVSDFPEYISYIGIKYVLEQELFISGVNAPPGYGQEVNYYTVGPKFPSWTGPELITRDTLAAGNVFIVESIEECINCMFSFGKLLKAKIRLTEYKTGHNLPIHIPLQYITRDYVSEVSF